MHRPSSIFATALRRISCSTDIVFTRFTLEAGQKNGSTDFSVPVPSVPSVPSFASVPVRSALVPLIVAVVNTLRVTNHVIP
jgi:hypothetical protein